MNSATADVMKLAPVLDLAAADQLLLELRERLQGPATLYLDAAAVETLTLPCVQIILSAAKGTGTFGVANPSAAFESAFADFGLDFPRAPDLVPDRNRTSHNPWMAMMKQSRLVFQTYPTIQSKSLS